MCPIIKLLLFNLWIILSKLIHIAPSTITTDIDVVSVISVTELLSHNVFLKQIHFFFVLAFKENSLHKFVKTILLLCVLEIFATSKIVIIYILSNMLTNIDFVVDYVCDLVD